MTVETFDRRLFNLHANVNVRSLIKLDLSSALSYIDRRSLLAKLEPVIKDPAVMRLIESFLYLSVTGKEEISNFTFKIPPLIYLTTILNLWIWNFI